MRNNKLSRAMLHRVLRFAVAAAMWVLVAGGLITFAFFYIMTPTRWFYVGASEFITWRNNLVLQYNFVDATTGKMTPLLPNTYSFILIWQWCASLAAALGAAGLLWAYPSESRKPRSRPVNPQYTKTPSTGTVWSIAKWPSAISKAAARVRWFMRWHVPPRGLWRKVLGPEGLSVLDLMILLLWFGLHIMWLREMTMKTLDARRASPSASSVSKAVVTGKINSTISNNVTRAASSNSSMSMPSITPAANISLGVNGTSNNDNVTRSARLRNLLLVNITNNGSNNLSSNTSMKTTATARTPVSNASSSKKVTVKPLKREVQNSMAKYTGMVGNFDLLLLFFPLPRCNFLHWLLKSDFPTLVKYHRWLGHGTILMYSLHAIFYMSLWTKDGTLSANMQWTMNSYVNNIAGLISLIAGWIIWITCIPFVRRRFFNLFYVSHIGGTVIFMLFAFMHRKDIAPWVMPGIFLYLLDVVLRTLQQAFNSTAISAASGPDAAAAATMSPHGNILTLTIQCNKCLSWSGLDIVFINVPEISWWQWHPFTLATSSVAGGPETKMVLHIKTYNHWTQRLAARLATSTVPLKLYVSGPYHGAHRKWITDFDRHIFIAGGIGVTPVLGMLQDLIACHRAASETIDRKPTGRVSLIWLSRSRDELATLPHDVLLEASRSGPEAWLDLQLYLTSSEESQENGHSSQESNVQPGNSTAVPISIPVGCMNPAAAINDDVRCSPAKSATVSKSTKRLLSHPYMLHPLLWALSAVLCFGGGFAGFICSQAYDAHISRTVVERNDYTHVGMLQFAALGLGAALPPALLMLVAHIYVELKTRQRGDAASASHSSGSSGGNFQPGECRNPFYDTKDQAGDSRTGSLPHHDHATATSIATNFSDEAFAAVTATQGSISGFNELEMHRAQQLTTGGAAVSCPTTKKGGQVNVHAEQSICSETYIKHGRPDLKALLELVARTGSAQLPQQPQPKDADAVLEPVSEVATVLDHWDLRVAVFAAGPRRLVEVVEEQCARLSGAWGSPGRYYLEAHPLTHEL